MPLRLLCMLLCCACAYSAEFPAEAGRPAEAAQPARSPEDEAELARLNGKWRIEYAAFQTAGPITYLFDNGTLVVESRQGDKHQAPNGPPPTTYVDRYRYRVDRTHAPKRLILTPVDQAGRKAKSNSGIANLSERAIYEFRAGRLWICPDDDPTPKTVASLRGNPPGDGWLVGLGRAN